LLTLAESEFYYLEYTYYIRLIITTDDNEEIWIREIKISVRTICK